MINPELQVMTRDGRPARIIATNETNEMGGYSYPILAEVEHPNHTGQFIRWHFMGNGQWKSNDSCNNNDLIHPWMAQGVAA